MVYRPFPSLVVRTNLGMPTPKYGFVCSNDFERAYPVKLLVILATRRLREIRSEVKLTNVEPKRRELTNKNSLTFGGSNSGLWIQGPSVNNRLLKLVDDLKREASSRQQMRIADKKFNFKRLTKAMYAICIRGDNFRPTYMG